MSKHKVDEITDAAGTGKPDFPNGITSSGDVLVTGKIRAYDVGMGGNTHVTVGGGGTVNATVPTVGSGVTGIVNITVTATGNAGVRTARTYFYHSRLGTPTLTLLASGNGFGGSVAFSVSPQSNNSITVTNNTGSTTSISIGFFVTGTF